MHPTVLALIATQRLADLYAEADRERLLRAARDTIDGQGSEAIRRRATGRRARAGVAALRGRLIRLVRPVRTAVAG